MNSSALIYVRNRRQTVEISNELKREGIISDFLSCRIAHGIQRPKTKAWIENHIRVMVCTNAFGMGVDKSDVSLVLHADLPNSLEEYFQEVGRAGRNGSRSYGVMLYHQKILNEL